MHLIFFLPKPLHKLVRLLPIPSCGSIGGGLGDAFLLADRASADALGQVAAFVQSCPVDVACRWLGGRRNVKGSGDVNKKKCNM